MQTSETRLPAGRGSAAYVEPSTDAEADVWVLLGKHHGDNQQLLALADALGRPYKRLQLHFNRWTRLPNLVLGRSLLSLQNPQELPPGNPRLILLAGRRTVAAARCLRKRSGGAPRLVALGRPCAPLHWFDLIVTTPQYGVPLRHNVQCNHLPLLKAPPRPPPPWPDVGLPPPERLSRPWSLFLLGGAARPYVFDREAARRVAEAVCRTVARDGGTVFVLASPRTPAAALDLIEQQVPAAVRLIHWPHEADPYAALRARADRLFVTSDSASMLGEALLTGKPVELLPLTQRPDRRLRAVRLLHSLGQRIGLIGALYRKLRDLGLMTSVRDLSVLHDRLAAAGAFSPAQAIPDLAALEWQSTLERVAGLLQDERPRRRHRPRRRAALRTRVRRGPRTSELSSRPPPDAGQA